MNPVEQLIESLLFCRLIVLIPVYICQAPEKSLISQLFRHLEIFFIIFALRRPVVSGHFLSGRLAESVFYCYHFFFKRIHVGYL